MTNEEKAAQEIYEMICATGGDRPFSGTSMGQLMRALADWRASNPAMNALERAEPAVLLAFLRHSLEWVKAEARVDSNFRVCGALMEAVGLALERSPKPLSADLVQHLLGEYRQEFSMARYNFPFHAFLRTFSREQVTEESRTELRKLHLQFAPSAAGKIDERTQKTRDLIADLMWTEGDKQLDPGRGPWSQIVFDEVRAKPDEIARAGWQGLLEHCHALEQTVPGAKWNKESRILIAALGEEEVTLTLLKWLALGPTPGQLPGATSPIEDSSYQKGVVWLLALTPNREVAIAIADFGLACLRKIPMVGAVSQKVGSACMQALGTMDCAEAVAQLTRLRGKVKYSVARKMIEKSLHKAAERSGLTVEELEDLSVADYGLNSDGVAESTLGDTLAAIHLGTEGRVEVVWVNADGKTGESAPSHIRKAYPKEVRSLAALGKELERAYQAQRFRLESGLLIARSMPLKHWQQYYIHHPLLGFLGRRLIWVFSDEQGEERAGMWLKETVCDATGAPIDVSAARKVRLWHPLSSGAEEVGKWRDWVFNNGIRQPFRQAFREFYELTEDERQARMYSNRFAGILMRQHQFASLCRERGWEYRLMGAHFDGANVPTRKIDSWNMHVQFHVDLPSDRDSKLLDSALGEQSAMGINVFVGSDQVRFYRDRREIGLGEVPPVVYSEVMRDVDLFTSVSAVGEDETWFDQGDRGAAVIRERFNLQEYTSLVALRGEMLSRALPHTAIADRCRVEKAWLEVRGNLGTYRIHLSWGGVMMAHDSKLKCLAIPRKLLDAVALDLSAIPVDLDYRTEMMLRKAHVLADDWRIDSPDLIRQLMPE